MEEPGKVGLKSMGIAEEKREQLRAIFPEVFSEGKIDFDQLRRVLGEWIDSGRERFGLNWPGKADCMKIIQQPSIATLKPDREESTSFDNTENLFIEGDNLEVLKLLQKAYFGRIKMIYIDPPYNTGKEFIYPDKYAETLDTYLEYTGQKDRNGNKFSTNTDVNGRYHSRWLSMIYPRLYLARNLLCENGVIFISIGDEEVSNLKKVCDEIFGEENFINQLVWKKKYTGGKHAKYFVDLHEYVLVYAKNNLEIEGFLFDRPDEEKDKFVHKDEYLEERGKYYVRPLKSNLEERKTLIYPIELPDGSFIETQWIVSRPTYCKMLEENRIEFRKKRNGKYQVYKKYYEKDGDGKVKPPSIIEHTSNNEAKNELKELFDVQEGRENIFYTVKPTALINHFMDVCVCDDDIILDFFAGSGTVADAVLRKNKLDGLHLKFIIVQLPEPIEDKKIIEKYGIKTIADIGKERIRRVAMKIKKEQNGQIDLNGNTNMDLGFKVFKLACSNFKTWEGNISDNGLDDLNKLAGQIEMHVNHIAESSTSEGILYELLLKSGYSLVTKVKKIQLAGRDIFSIEDGALLICLDRDITQDMIDAMAEAGPQQVICLDEGFKGNDQLKANAVQTFKSRSQQQQREIIFRTV